LLCNLARVLLQLSPNHVSKDHSWFDKHSGFFVVKDSAEANKSTWKSQYGANAWTPFGDGSNSFYHQFRDTEADLNYADEELVKQMNVSKASSASNNKVTTTAWFCGVR